MIQAINKLLEKWGFYSRVTEIADGRVIVHRAGKEDIESLNAIVRGYIPDVQVVEVRKCIMGGGIEETHTRYGH